MGVGVGILLVAVGAILAFAVNGNNVDTNGIVNLHSAGLVLLVVGVVGILLSVAFWSSWGGRGIGSRERVSQTGPVDDRAVIGQTVDGRPIVGRRDDRAVAGRPVEAGPVVDER
jgi:hypothetical protein